MGVYCQGLSHLGVWHTNCGSVEEYPAGAAAGVAGEAHGVRHRGLRRLLLELPLHAPVVLPLHLNTVLDPSLGIVERPVLQLAHQFGVEGRLLGSDGIQVAHTVHVGLGGGHVQGRVVVVVQAPNVGTKRHQEGQAVLVAIGSGQVEWCISPYVTLIRVPSGKNKKAKSH